MMSAEHSRISQRNSAFLCAVITQPMSVSASE